MTRGEEIAGKLRVGKNGGIPWLVILDGRGKALITSDGPRGNIGCPIKSEERAWFINMIRKTKKRMTEAQIALVEESLAAYANKLGY